MDVSLRKGGCSVTKLAFAGIRRAARARTCEQRQRFRTAEGLFINQEKSRA
jgi:hypothetical protein